MKSNQMKNLSLLIYCLLCTSILGDTYYAYYGEKTYKFKIADERQAECPKWDPEKGQNPPYPAGKALAQAKKFIAKLPESEEIPGSDWRFRDLALVKIGGGWAWRATYHFRTSKYTRRILPAMYCFILMDGSLVDPIVVRNPPLPEIPHDAISQKAQAIVVPKVDFKQTPLKEALTFLQEQARIHDPEKKRVIYITVEDADVADKPITLALTNTPIWTVLQYVAIEADCSMTTGKNGIVLKRRKEAIIPTRDQAGKNLDGQLVHVGGCVGASGPKAYKPDMTLVEFITASGGVSAFGSNKRVELYRNGKKYIYDLRKREHMNVKVHPKDTIIVPQKTVFGN